MADKRKVHVTVTGSDELTPAQRERAAEIARQVLGDDVEIIGVDPEPEAK